MLRQFGVYMVGNDIDFDIRGHNGVMPSEHVWHVIRQDGQLVQTYFSERLALSDAKARADIDNEEFEKIMLEPTE